MAVDLRKARDMLEGFKGMVAAHAGGPVPAEVTDHLTNLKVRTPAAVHNACLPACLPSLSPSHGISQPQWEHDEGVHTGSVACAGGGVCARRGVDFGGACMRVCVVPSLFPVFVDCRLSRNTGISLSHDPYICSSVCLCVLVAVSDCVVISLCLCLCLCLCGGPACCSLK